MRKITVDFRKGFAKVKIENADDMWFLSQIIDSGDLISGKTLRKIKIGSEDDRKQKVSKKPVFIKIKVGKVEFSESSTVLRVLGVIEEGPEDVAKGEHHTFNLEVGTEITIEKETWLNYQKEKLEEAFKSKISNILLVVFDREDAYFALMKKYGFEILSHIEGNVAKKDMESGKVTNFYSEIINQINEYDSRYNFDNIIVGSPAFWKDELLKNLKDDKLKKKMVMATCSSVDKSGINEILKRDEVKSVLSSDRITREINLVEQLMQEISNDGKEAYGMKDVLNATNSGAVEVLLVSDALIMKLRSNGKIEELDNIMKTADSMKAKVHIISSKHEGGKELDGLGGIAAVLRYKMA